LDPELVITKLEQLLDEERLAIRRLDGARVEACASEKVALFGHLMTLDAKGRSILAPRLKALVAQLRRNGVLLVHARSILADVLRLKGATVNEGLSKFAKAPTTQAGGRLSIRG
jgi:hypothetical protein